VVAVSIKNSIARQAEANVPRFPWRRRREQLSVAEAICEAISHAAEEQAMKLIAVFTESGSTARLISKYRPRPPIVGFSPNKETRRRLSLLWGVLPRTIAPVRNIDSLTALAEKRLLEEKLVSRGDVIGIVAGTPFGVRGTTNFMKLHTVSR